MTVRLNTSIRHGKVIIISDDVQKFINLEAEQVVILNEREQERYRALQFLKNPDTVILLHIGFGQVFDVPMFKGNDEKVGHCLTLNPSNIIGFLSE